MVPRPAATLILLRRGGRHADRGVEVLMVRRTEAASFMPGAWVFPGGAVDASEATAGRPGEAQGEELDADELAHRACAIRELREEAGIELPGETELVPWSRWITPEPSPVRFDTRFYVALAPPHSPPRPDGVEVTAARWYEPSDALERHADGELEMVFPTIRHLESLLPYGSAEEVLAAAAEREIEPVLPRIVGDEENPRIVLPGWDS
jgi:8-oxo-dGTP pyrophosphatase MutT (NUDIX family)